MPHGMAEKQKKKWEKSRKIRGKIEEENGSIYLGLQIQKQKKKTRNGERMIEKKYDSMWGGKISQIN